MNKNCEQCGGPFVAKQARARCCSRPCRSKKYCKENKAAIAAKKKKYREENKAANAAARKKYCKENKAALAAQKKKYREKIRKQKLARLPDRHCLDCHSPIPAAAHLTRKFCSRKCYETYRDYKDTTGDASFFELITATHALSETLTNTQTKTTQSNP